MATVTARDETPSGKPLDSWALPDLPVHHRRGAAAAAGTRGGGPLQRGRAGVLLPFEDDAMLSMMLSKALLLAADAKITDESILYQIKRR